MLKFKRFWVHPPLKCYQKMLRAIKHDVGCLHATNKHMPVCVYRVTCSVLQHACWVVLSLVSVHVLVLSVCFCIRIVFCKPHAGFSKFSSVPQTSKNRKKNRAYRTECGVKRVVPVVHWSDDICFADRLHLRAHFGTCVRWRYALALSCRTWQCIFGQTWGKTLDGRCNVGFRFSCVCAFLRIRLRFAWCVCFSSFWITLCILHIFECTKFTKCRCNSVQNMVWRTKCSFNNAYLGLGTLNQS